MKEITYARTEANKEDCVLPTNHDATMRHSFSSSSFANHSCRETIHSHSRPRNLGQYFDAYTKRRQCIRDIPRL